jgi:hypothetical protein
VSKRGTTSPDFDHGDVRLLQADLRGEFPLPPAPLSSRVLYLLTHINVQATESEGLDALWRMRAHFYTL